MRRWGPPIVVGCLIALLALAAKISGEADAELTLARLHNNDPSTLGLAASSCLPWGGPCDEAAEALVAGADRDPFYAQMLVEASRGASSALGEPHASRIEGSKSAMAMAESSRSRFPAPSPWWRLIAGLSFYGLVASGVVVVVQADRGGGLGAGRRAWYTTGAAVALYGVWMWSTTAM